MRFFFVIVFFLTCSCHVNAQWVRVPEDRSGKFDISLMWKFQGGQNLTGRGGSKLDFSDNNNVGFVFGYNFTNLLNLQWEISFLNPKYRATLVKDDDTTESVNNRANFTTSQFNFTWHWLEGDVTPFLMAGLGWSLVDSNIAKEGSTVCYWDPWYGYVCYARTYKENDFSYNAGIGLRWDINDRFFTRGSYGIQWVDFGNGIGTTDFQTGRLEIGVKF
ncbi:Uncharacterised protein [BD1-7 clade bacterium]|uniref:Outer membrane protein beta-barrel domain-containing protein n=1 Tax=BD1-7 clade bacterium TaxID=2029982 RepID=A0A5S9QJG9_9GAMM|nr:Uncharacterised protein [BD1-7 clade bacterium]CAA0120556.1 Uncharacterised protein [BD1-7 clade bacterium]